MGARTGLGAVAAALLLAAAGQPGGELHAQVKASEKAAVEQTVDGTVIAVEYARPRARGRDALFGGVVHWEEVWTPGANDATVLDLSRDVEIEGHPVPAGRWSVWMVVREEGPWELVLDPRADLWHTVHPDETDDQIRFPVETEPTDPVGTLLWYFPEVRHDGTTLVMTWDDVRVPLDIAVEPTWDYTVTEAEAAPFLGSWRMEGAMEMNEGRTRELEIVHHRDGSLRALVSGERGPEWILQRKTEGIFAIGRTMNGELMGDAGAFLEMIYEDGEPVAFEIRRLNDTVSWRGERVR